MSFKAILAKLLKHAKMYEINVFHALAHFEKLTNKSFFENYSRYRLIKEQISVRCVVFGAILWFNDKRFDPRLKELFVEVLDEIECDYFADLLFILHSFNKDRDFSNDDPSKNADTWYEMRFLQQICNADESNIFQERTSINNCSTSDNAFPKPLTKKDKNCPVGFADFEKTDFSCCASEQTRYAYNGVIYGGIQTFTEKKISLIDICVNVTESENAKKNSLYIKTSDFSAELNARQYHWTKMFGSLNWLLFRTFSANHFLALRKKATDIYKTLFKITSSRLVLNRIVSFEMLLNEETPYASSLFYSTAPEVFREIVSAENVPCRIPIMASLSAFSSYGPNDGRFLDLPKESKVIFDFAKGDKRCTQSVSYFSFTFFGTETFNPNIKTTFFSSLYSTVHLPVCLLIRSLDNQPIESLTLIGANQKPILLISGKDAFITKDEGGSIWYSMSLLPFCNNRDALVYHRHSSFNRPIDLNSDWFRLKMDWAFEQGQKVVQVYARCLKTAEIADGIY